MVYVLGLVLIGASVAFVLLFKDERQERKNREAEIKRLDAELTGINEKFRPVTDAQEEKSRILQEAESARQAILADLTVSRAELTKLITEETITEKNLNARIQQLRIEFKKLDEEANLQSCGFYRPHYDFADSERYQNKLEEIRRQQSELLKQKTAAVGDQEWAVNGSVKEGRKQINQTLKLMLRAFNGECDAAVIRVRYNNFKVMESRIQKAFETINGLAEVQQCRITRDYLNLKLQELYLAFEYQEKVQAEKEEQRRIREQMREEEIAQREIEKAKQQAEEEERRYEVALSKARDEVEKSTGAKHDKLMEQVSALEQKLAEAHSNKERAISRAQMTRSGHVYVISNIGSFGEHVFKIGMTRRLEPLDRVKELGDASVPFSFDVHAVIFSEDAPALESKLHKILEGQRVNLVNERKEFFNIKLQQVAEIVKGHCGEIEFTKIAAAEEFRKTQALRTESTVISDLPKSFAANNSTSVV
jgi:hypothetical protein